LRILYIADLVGKPGRVMFKYHLKNIKEKYAVDTVIVNGENASHGFGLSTKNAKELFNAGVDLFTGGNHSWDKKDIVPFLEIENIIRPLNYPKAAPGKGIAYMDVAGETLVIINLMGYFTMPMVDNPFTMIVEEVARLRDEGYNNIFIDFHAEATSEKRALFAMLKGKVSAICGSHTHVGTDDLVIEEGTFYVTDVGLTGCRDNVIGMDNKQPLDRFLTGLGGKFDVPSQCKKILQGVVFEIEKGKCVNAFKIKAYDEREVEISQYALKE
jgi:metallophosphoesterase (TIGR00282 family)